MERYENLFAQLNDRRKALLSLRDPGDPGIEQSLKIIDTLIDAGADALELGFPSPIRWPMALLSRMRTYAPSPLASRRLSVLKCWR